MKQIDTGGLSFQELMKREKYYVDKSLFIKDILSENDRDVYLFTRPRRFGKTTNLTMLDAFFNMEYKGNNWFDGLAISEHPEFDRYKNEFPVISIDMKILKENNFNSFLDAFGGMVLEIYKKFPAVWNSSVVMEDECIMYDRLIKGTATEAQLKSSILKLARLLVRFYQRNVVVLIDEYDRAVSDAFGEESHRPIMDFLGGFMNTTLKGNDSLQLACVTGVMQIAKESIFSDLNNIKINNIFSLKSDERFGFTEAEVKEIFAYYGGPDKFDEARQWYDGYRFGNAEVYNPFSIMNYVSDGFIPGYYWANSGGDWIMRRFLETVDQDNVTSVLNIVTGGSAETKLYESLVFADLWDGDDVTLYSLMAMSGYLKAVPAGQRRFLISMPNEEVRTILDNLLDKLKPVDTTLFAKFNAAVLDGDAEKMAYLLEKILLGGSYRNLRENAYEIVLMTVMHSLVRRYEVKTEYDAGNGRTDITLTPKVPKDPPLIFELKVSDSEKDLDRDLDEALDQIHRKRYYMGMPGKVILIGMSFFVKTARVRTEVIDNGPDGLGHKDLS